jgi:hypothetical protein
MIFVSTGQGGWIPGSLILSICLMMGLDQWLLAPPLRFWPFTMSIALAGLFRVGLGLHGRFSPASWVRDTATGCERFKRPSHTAYWIRAEYWGLIYLGLATWLQSMGQTGAMRGLSVVRWCGSGPTGSSTDPTRGRRIVSGIGVSSRFDSDSNLWIRRLKNKSRMAVRTGCLARATRSRRSMRSAFSRKRTAGIAYCRPRSPRHGAPVKFLTRICPRCSIREKRSSAVRTIGRDLFQGGHCYMHSYSRLSLWRCSATT